MHALSKVRKVNILDFSLSLCQFILISTRQLLIKMTAFIIFIQWVVSHAYIFAKKRSS